MRNMNLNVIKPASAHIVSLVTAIITFIVYLPSLLNDFVTWDDNLYIYENDHIKTFDFAFLKWAFSDFHTGNWHPLTWLSHAIDYAVWGLNPVGHHLTSVLFHASNTYLVTLLAVWLIETYRSKSDHGNHELSLSPKSVLVAGSVAGLLFGLHPLHVESVAWISERKDVLCSFFFLLGLLEYIRYASALEEPNPVRHTLSSVRCRYCTVFILFVLAVVSKPMAITFPAVLLILDWFPLQRLRTTEGRKRAVMEKMPFFIAAMAFAGTAFIAQKSALAVADRNPIPVAAKIMNAAKAIIDYLLNMAWPTDLMPFYPHPYWENPDLTSTIYTLPALTIVFISAFCIVMIIKRQQLWLAVWAGYLIMLLPVLGIIQLGAQGMADRYTYLPSLGPFIMVGIAAGFAGEEIIQNARKTAFVSLLAALGVFIILLPNATNRQIHVWENGVTLWTHEINMLRKKSSASAFAYRTAYDGLGYANMRNKNYEQAITDFSNVILFKPDDVGAYQQRAIAHARLGNLEKAIKDFSSAIAINPDISQLYYNRGTAFAGQGRFSEAVQDMTKAITISSKTHPEYYLNRGLALKKLGRIKEGDRDIAEAGNLKNRSFEERNGAFERPL
jgi:hypothetical protein